LIKKTWFKRRTILKKTETKQRLKEKEEEETCEGIDGLRNRDSHVSQKVAQEYADH